jgi:predicted short-subunit dehydrogenase-like oxidoreductase (DUF2520 family)
VQKTTKHKIVILGCGNVAWHIAKHFSKLKKFEVIVYNHKPNSLLNEFRKKLKFQTFSNLDSVIEDADIYFICVADKAISSVAKKIKLNKPTSVLVHTSGSAKIDELGHVSNAAVFYPLQSFSRNDVVNWKEVPLIVEAKTTLAKKKMIEIAHLFSKKVFSKMYKERLKLHLAAVLVNNFANALYVEAQELTENKLEILLPLIKQTVLKLEKMNPRLAQTGPAKRKDDVVMKKHLKLLSEKKDLKKIYDQMSKLIVKQQTKDHA